MAEEAQPPEGQGDQGSGGLYDSYLQFVPPEHREAAQSHLEEVSKSVNSRLEEAANLRSTYEPYTQIPGLNLYQPQELGDLVSWHQDITSTPESFRDWLTAAAKESGLTVAESEALEDMATGSDDDLARLQQQMEQQIAPVQEQIQELRNTQFINNESALIQDRFSQIEADEHLTLNKEQKDMIVDLGLGAMPGDDASLSSGQDWIGAGWDRFKAIYAEAQTTFVNDKTSAPKPAMESGATPVFELPKTWDDAKARAGERLRQSRA